MEVKAAVLVVAEADKAADVVALADVLVDRAAKVADDPAGRVAKVVDQAETKSAIQLNSSGRFCELASG